MTDSQSRAWLRQQAYRFPSAVNEPWEPFRNQGKIGDPIAVGCSITYGVGVAIDQTWHAQIERHYCIAQPAASLESVWRLLRHWIKIVQPPRVRLLTPPMGRRECWMSYGARQMSPANHSLIEEFAHETEIQLHQLRMLDAIRHCVGHTPIDIVTWESIAHLVTDHGDDGQHPGPESHRNIANCFK